MLKMRQALRGVLLAVATTFSVATSAATISTAPQPVVSSVPIFRANNYNASQEAIVGGSRYTYYPSGCVDDGVHCIHDSAGHSYVLRTSSVPPAGGATLGGVFSHTPVSGQFVTGIGTDGVVSAAVPNAGAISGLAPIATSGSATDLTTGSVPPCRTLGLNGVLDARCFTLDGVTVDTIALQAALNYASAHGIPVVKTGAAQTALITSLSVPDFITLDIGGNPASKLANLRDYRLSTGIQGVLQYSSLGSCISMGTASAIVNGTIERGDGLYPPTTFWPVTTRDGLNVRGAQAGSVICAGNPSSSIRNVSILGFGLGVTQSSVSQKLIDVIVDGTAGVLYSGAEDDQAERLQIGSKLTQGLDLSSNLVYMGDDGSNQYEVTWDVSATGQFSFANGDAFFVQPPTTGAQSAAGGWVISNAAVRANGVKGCTRSQGCPGGTLTGSNVSGTTLSGTWTNTPDAAGDYFIQVTPGSTAALANNQNVSSATCIAGGTKIKDIWDALGRIYLSAPPTCSAGPQNVVFTDDAWVSGGTGFVDPGGRSGDGIEFINSSGIKVDQSIIFSHDTELHFFDGSRNIHVKGCTTGENNTSLDEGKVGILIDGTHSGYDADTLFIEDCNAGQHAFKGIEINSDSTARDYFVDVLAAPGTARTAATSIQVDSGSAQFSNISTGTSRANVFVADGATFHVVYADGNNLGSGYSVGDVLTTTGGTCTTQAQYTVAAVNGSGALKLSSAGGGAQTRAFVCTVYPSNPITTTGGTGVGAKLKTDGSVSNNVSIANMTNALSDLYLQTIPGTAFQGSNNRCSVPVICNWLPNLNVGSLSVNSAPAAPIATSGSAGDLSTGTVPPARLPGPTAVTLGGVQSKTAVPHQFLTQITLATGAVLGAQPACGDISDASGPCNSPSAKHTDISTGITLTAGSACTYYRVDATSGALTETLPVSGTNDDCIIVRKGDSGANRVTVQYNGGTDAAWLSTQYDEAMFAYWGGAWTPVKWSIAPITDVYTATGANTWTKPPLAKSVSVRLFAAGNGGGSGRRGAAGSGRAGGNGGQAGAVVDGLFLASALSSTETVTVGSGAGTGGAAQTVDSTNGNGGTAGGNTTLGSRLRAQNTNTQGGNGGTSTAATGISVNNSTYGIQPVQGSTSITAAGGAGGSGVGGSGAAGGGITVGDVPQAGGNGGIGSFQCGSNAASGGGGAINTTGSNGGAVGSTTSQCGGGGGGGGGGSIVGVAGTGGTGGAPAGGGAGGGASLNGNNSGAGGDGARGEARVTTTF